MPKLLFEVNLTVKAVIVNSFSPSCHLLDILTQSIKYPQNIFLGN